MSLAIDPLANGSPLPTGTPSRLGSALVDLSLSTDQPILTVPAGRSAIVTGFVFRSPSSALVAATFGLGFNVGVCTDNLAAATMATLLTGTLQQVSSKAGAAVGAAAGVLSLRTTVQQAVTMTVDALGYLI